MIEHVTIENFQSHKHTELDFVKGANVIIGKSDTGKSAVFRAINWVITNRPLGDSFRSEWGGDTRVVLKTSEGHTIGRVRTDTENMYVLDGEKLKAFGTEVPQPVLDVLRLDAFHIQAQMDAPFLLSSTPGEAAKILNQAASIDDIDHTISGLKKSMNKVKSDISYMEQEKQKYEEELKEYSNLDDIEEQLKQVEQLEKKYLAEMENTEKLKQMVSKIRNAQSILSLSNYVPKVLVRMQKLNEKYEQYTTMEFQYQKLLHLYNKIEALDSEIQQTSYVPQALKELREVEKTMVLWNKKDEQKATWGHILKEIDEVLQEMNDVEKILKKLNDEYDRISPETCPLCGAEMKKEKKHETNETTEESYSHINS